MKMQESEKFDQKGTKNDKTSMKFGEKVENMKLLKIRSSPKTEKIEI